MSKPEDLPPMEYRFLGRSGLQVSAISLGGWLTYGGHIDAEGTFECMKAAYDSGVNFFDTAEVYSSGESEIVMGQAIRKYGWKRNDLVISTKIYWGGAFGDNIVNNKGLSRKHVIEAMDACLERLDLSYVDLVYAHRPDRQTPMEETVRAFNHLISTGKALYWGTSEWSADEIAQAWRYADKLHLIGPVMEQPSYSMLDRKKVEHEFFHLYREVGLGLTVFSPLRQGILSGKYKNGIPEDSRFGSEKIGFIKDYWKREDAKKQFQDLVDKANKIEPIAEKLGVKMATLALAWVLKNKNVSSAIIGASSPAQIYENVRALGVQEKLTPEVMAEIDEALDNKPDAIIPRF
ncbi:voltage-dependent potassium channel beta subunit [Colletotrichum navitas]|uniref:Voltage-dependent potassium channel beta subunit n=1 Tax=Colletotrichum navitas TaxID=681940 RepID=A0AAD8V4Y9_9PEZI|nr:voltage-dependent potassium channel beta subunit [Colletotrichum navitas]KAK1589698.1 voltage-dependent potassium channel beta subunit [Colletotrichum navitas]